MSKYLVNITDGLVSVEDGLKAPEEYAPARKVRVELKFSSFDGDTAEYVDGIISAAVARATAEVDRLLGRDKKAPAAPAPTADAAAEVVDTPAPATRKRRTKAEIEAEAAAKVEVVDGPLATEEDFDIMGDAGAQDAKGNPVMEDVADEDIFDVGGDEPEVSDADLNSAVQKKNADLGDANIIRGLIKTFNPDPTKVFQLREIPQAQRQDFLTKLAALAKA